ncbi:MAG: hypothetical protein NTX97_06465 [Bacteroidetes bacterium]|nr:hypothetical protein [Bacteroidota bacterium]
MSSTLPHIGIITQARMTSTRLPAKIFKEVNHKPLLQYHIERLQKTGFDIAIATTINSTDDCVVDFAEIHKISSHRGSENNVLSRFHETAKKYNFDIIIRVTSDCPLIDPHIIRNSIEKYLKFNNPNLYMSNGVERTFARGFDFEIFSFKLLDEAFKNATLESDLEHVTPYIWNNRSGEVELYHVKQDQKNNGLRITVDGYSLIQHVFSIEEIENIRRLIYEKFEIDKKNGLTFQLPHLPTKARYAKGDLLSKEKLRNILLDDRILTIVKKILGSDDIIYFGDSSYQIGKGMRGFHRDSIDRTDLNGPDWQGNDYSLLRVGIYLQDHKNYSGGVKMKQGTHKKADGKVVFVDSEIGDVGVWSYKTLHSGNAVRFKWFPKLSINRATREGLVPAFLRKEEQKERIAIFMAFSTKTSHLDRYIKEFSLKRTDMIDHLKVSKYDSASIELAKQKKLEVMKLLPEQE